MAESFLKVEKWAEALVLYQRALTYVEEAKGGGNLQVRERERLDEKSEL